MRETVEIEPNGSPCGSVIWLHGLGADGHDFEAIVPELGLGDSLPLRFVFPHAPVRPVTLNGGMAMRAWFDIYGVDRSARVDEAGIGGSVAQVEALISRECERGMTLGQVTLAGFSQGGCIALTAALTYPARLAGVIGLSTYLPRAAETLAGRSDANADLPVFLAHGIYDPVLPLALGQEVHQALDAAGYNAEWHDYPMPHAVCPDEIAAIAAFLRRIYDR